VMLATMQPLCNNTPELNEGAGQCTKQESVRITAASLQSL
jgi:hypothetical protein